MTGAGHPLVAVLAAGAARRFGADKLLANVAGQALLEWTLDAVLDAAAPRHVRVVVDEPGGSRARAAIARGVEVLVAPRAAEGMRASLDAACAAARASGSGGLVVVLADDPLAADELPAVLTHAAVAPGAACAIDRIPPVPHPVYLPVAYLPPPLGVDDEVEDVGLRALLPDGATTWLRSSSAGPPIDVDTPADLERLDAELVSRAAGRE